MRRWNSCCALPFAPPVVCQTPAALDGAAPQEGSGGSGGSGIGGKNTCASRRGSPTCRTDVDGASTITPHADRPAGQWLAGDGRRPALRTGRTARSAALKCTSFPPIHGSCGCRPSRPSRHPAVPLLKWAGGKRQLLPALAAYYPVRFDRYVEAFLGSGAVFFDLLAQGRLAGTRVTLADVNPDLIGCYRTLRDHTSQVIAALAALETEHRSLRRGVLLRRARPALQPRTRRAVRGRRQGARAPGGRVSARTGGDADLPQPHRVQRAVPPQSQRRLQRAGGALRRAADLRSRAPAHGGRGVPRAGRHAGVERLREPCSPTPARATSSTAIRRTRR